MNPQIIDGMSNKEYHAHPALGSTSLKTLATKTPAHYRWQADHPVHKDVFDLGTVAHSLILEGDTTGVEVLDYPAWTTKAAREARDDARNQGKIPLLEKDWQEVMAMHDAVMAHPEARALLTGHRPETSVFWEEDGLHLKCRPDAWQHGLLIDLKTTRTADPNEFGRTAAEFGYHQSAGHYIDGVKAITGEELPFKFILVEKTAPYFVSVVELDIEAVGIGRQLNDRAKRIYRECTETGRWPGYTNSEPVNLPMWAIYKAEDLLGIGSDDIEMSV